MIHFPSLRLFRSTNYQRILWGGDLLFHRDESEFISGLYLQMSVCTPLKVDWLLCWPAHRGIQTPQRLSGAAPRDLWARSWFWRNTSSCQSRAAGSPGVTDGADSEGMKNRKKKQIYDSTTGTVYTTYVRQLKKVNQGHYFNTLDALRIQYSVYISSDQYLPTAFANAVSFSWILWFQTHWLLCSIPLFKYGIIHLNAKSVFYKIKSFNKIQDTKKR